MIGKVFKWTPGPSTASIYDRLMVLAVIKAPDSLLVMLFDKRQNLKPPTLSAGYTIRDVMDKKYWKEV